MTKPLLAILLLLSPLVFGGCEFEGAVNCEIDRNSNTVTVMHEVKSAMTCRINSASEMVGPSELV